MSRLKRNNPEVRRLLNEILQAAKDAPVPLTAEEMARRIGIAPETLSRMKREGRADSAVIADLAALLGMRLKLVPLDDIKDKMLAGSFFDHD